MKRRWTVAVAALLMAMSSVVSSEAQERSQQAPSEAKLTPAQPVDVWLDVDTSTGVIRGRPRDVDDGLAMIYAFHSPEITVRGVSVQFGNANLDEALPIAKDIVGKFGPAGLGVYSGAASAEDLGKETEATKALAAELARRELTVIAVGPVTNVATVVKNHPELRPRIKSIVMCAARRPGFDFHPPGRPEIKMPDANFEKDVPAMQVLLDSGVPLVFGGYEVSCDTWIHRADLEKLATAGESGKWIASTSGYWLAMWENVLKLEGFNPFDACCVGWVTTPGMFEGVPVRARITTGPDDRKPGRLAATKPSKAYLVCDPVKEGEKSNVTYLTATKPEFTPQLLERLGGK
jgi:pyrimidine-specific ribonucleoside hydrolase